MRKDPDTSGPDEPVTPPGSEGLVREMAALRAEVARLNDHRFFLRQTQPVRLLVFQFARGLAFGLGSILGATILVSVLVYFLSQLELIPIIGEWAARITDEMRALQEER